MHGNIWNGTRSLHDLYETTIWQKCVYAVERVSNVMMIRFIKPTHLMTLPHSTLSPFNVTHALWNDRQRGGLGLGHLAEPFLAQDIVEDVLALDVILFFAYTEHSLNTTHVRINHPWHYKQRSVIVCSDKHVFLCLKNDIWTHVFALRIASLLSNYSTDHCPY